jgi:hypothetical protein
MPHYAAITGSLFSSYYATDYTALDEPDNSTINTTLQASEQ